MHHVRRTWWSYLGYVAWIAFTLFKIYSPNTKWPIIWIVLLTLKLVLLVRIIIKRNYFEVKDSTLTIRRDFFYNDNIEITDIENIELRSGPFAKSRIKLKNGARDVKFRFFTVNDEDFKQFIHAFHLKAEKSKRASM
jgi:hypothetical protein